MPFNDHITTSFTLYEDYIVFERNSPFGSAFNVSEMYPQDAYLYYKACTTGDYELTELVKYNFKFGKIEEINVYGKTIATTSDELTELVIDCKVGFSEYKAAECDLEIEKLIERVKTTAIKR